MDLDALLAQVARGRFEFRADGDSDEAFREFGMTVDAACHAFMRGYVASLHTQWGERCGRRCTEAVFVRELTEKGRRFLDKVEAKIVPVRA